MFDWIVGLVEQTSYVGIALLMLAENIFPPIPSELIMPLAGFSAAQGEMNLVGVVIAGTIGSLIGALLWYWIGRAVGSERLKRWAALHGRWLTMSPSDVEQAQSVFARYQAVAVFVGRLIPAIRTLISVPAGITRMRLPTFLFWTAFGTTLWTAFLAGAGYLLESQYEAVQGWINPLSNVVVILLLVIYVYRLVTFGRRNRA